MEEIHEVTSFVSLLHIFNSLDNQISTRSNSTNSQKHILCEKVCSQPLHQKKTLQIITRIVTEENMHVNYLAKYLRILYILSPSQKMSTLALIWGPRYEACVVNPVAIPQSQDHVAELDLATVETS